MNKKAQGEVITTVLIILLVLAAIVIVWQVVNSTVSKGAKQVESQAGCIGLGFEITDTVTPREFIIKRIAQGGVFKSTDLIVLVNKEKKDNSTYTITSSNIAGEYLKAPLDTIKITIADDGSGTPIDSIEIALVGNGVTCPTTAQWPNL